MDIYVDIYELLVGWPPFTRRQPYGAVQDTCIDVYICVLHVSVCVDVPFIDDKSMLVLKVCV